MQSDLTIYSRLRAFHWKMVHGLVYANKELFRFGHKEESNCFLCTTPKQTFQHLLASCPYIEGSVWRKLVQLFPNIITSEDLQEKAKVTAMLWTDDELFLTRNFLMLITKNYIYDCNLKEAKPSIQGLKSVLLSYEKIEKSIATKKDKLDRHFDKWEPILNAMSLGIPQYYSNLA